MCLEVGCARLVAGKDPNGPKWPAKWANSFLLVSPCFNPVTFFGFKPWDLGAVSTAIIFDDISRKKLPRFHDNKVGE